MMSWPIFSSIDSDARVASTHEPLAGAGFDLAFCRLSAGRAAKTLDTLRLSRTSRIVLMVRTSSPCCHELLSQWRLANNSRQSGGRWSTANEESPQAGVYFVRDAAGLSLMQQTFQGER